MIEGLIGNPVRVRKAAGEGRSTEVDSLGRAVCQDALNRDPLLTTQHLGCKKPMGERKETKGEGRVGGRELNAHQPNREARSPQGVVRAQRPSLVREIQPPTTRVRARKKEKHT